ncbi:hypothetical protein [Thermogemmatispora sp.]|uniref:hypothetical protein n=1 Tax=Thermogemmatispora sp. TaxID=1968838 RepID=UPI0035E405DD
MEPKQEPKPLTLETRFANKCIVVQDRRYLPVQWRLVWFRELCPQGTIETEIVHLDLDRETEEEYYGYNRDTRRTEKMVRRAKGFVIVRAVVKDGRGGVATGTKSEKAASFPDFIEKAETGAIGRALAALGFGTQFALELEEQLPPPNQRPSSPPLPSSPPASSPSVTTSPQPSSSSPQPPSSSGSAHSHDGHERRSAPQPSQP